MTGLTEFFGEPISVYSMEQALADGALVDADSMAAELVRWRVLLTQAVHADCVSWTDADSETTGAHGQSETGRLWDVLWMTFVALRHLPRDASRARGLDAHFHQHHTAVVSSVAKVDV